MKKSNRHRSKKIGMAPGSLVHVGEVKTAQPAVSIFRFAKDEFSERTLSAEALADLALPDGGEKLWLNVHGAHDVALIRQIGQLFQLHPLVMEDILNTDQRAKVDQYGDYLYIVTRCFHYDAKKMEIGSEQISLVLGKHYVLSFQERATGSFDPVRERLRTAHAAIREQGADYLAYALLDVVVDRYFGILEQMNDAAETLEDLLLRKPNAALLTQIHLLKRASMELRRAVWPLREVINSLLRNESAMFSPSTVLYLRDVYDHTVHFIESLEALRDLLGGMMDIYLSSVSNRVNMEVRALTVVTMLFMPATLISGIFGMNFEHIPWLADLDGFWFALALMASIASLMGLIFWRRQWLSRG